MKLLVVFKGRVLTPGIIPKFYSTNSIRLWVRERETASQNGVLDSFIRGAHYPEIFTSSIARWHKYVFSHLKHCTISIALHAPPASRQSRIEIERALSMYNISLIVWKSAKNQWDRIVQSLNLINGSFDNILISRLDLAPRNIIPIPTLHNTIMFPFYEKTWLCDSIILLPGECVSLFTKIIHNMSLSNDPMIAHTSLAGMLQQSHVNVQVWLPSRNYTCGTGSLLTVDNPMYELLGRNTLLTRFTLTLLIFIGVFSLILLGNIIFKLRGSIDSKSTCAASIIKESELLVQTSSNKK